MDLEELTGLLQGTITYDNGQYDASKAESVIEENNPIRKYMSEDQRDECTRYRRMASTAITRVGGRLIADNLKQHPDLGYGEVRVRSKECEYGVSIARPEGENRTRDHYLSGIAAYHRVELDDEVCSVASVLADYLME